ncbi:MAG: DUF1801 domain-containing protein [Kofleriaceae bacterium]
MRNSATTVKQYLASLPAERRPAIARVRDVINANLPNGYEEGMSFGMICWYVPFTRLAKTYNGQPLCYAALASQKNHMALYLMAVYGHKAVEREFRKGFADAGKKLDMGKSCVRFTAIDDLPLEVIGKTIARVGVDDYVELYERTRGSLRSAATTTTASTKRTPAKRTPAKRTPTKRTPAKRTPAKQLAAKRVVSSRSTAGRTKQRTKGHG